MIALLPLVPLPLLERLHPLRGRVQPDTGAILLLSEGNIQIGLYFIERRDIIANSMQKVGQYGKLKLFLDFIYGWSLRLVVDDIAELGCV